VGGYLGIGERDIAVPFDQIRFVNEPRVNTPGTTTGEARLPGTSPANGTIASPAATATGAVPASPNSPATSNMAANNAPVRDTPGVLGQAAAARSGSAPNHAILMMSITKDELRAAPSSERPAEVCPDRKVFETTVAVSTAPQAAAPAVQTSFDSLARQKRR
jgi:hypothetical protein